MHKTDDKKKSVGILGGGQLSLFLCRAANKLGLDVSVYVDKETDPVINEPVSLFFSIAKDDHRNIDGFLSKSKIVTFENEFIDTRWVSDKSINFSGIFIPGLSVMARCQDKLKQKKLFQDLGIPTSDYCEVPRKKDVMDLVQWLSELLKRENKEFVLKWARFGYDGKGNYVLRKNSNVRDAAEFCLTGFKKNSVVFAEEFVAFEKELALVSAFSVNQEFISYPLVITEQRNNVCHKVMGPATAFGVTQAVENQAKAHAKKLAMELGYFGTFAMEFFLTKKGDILINEMAPRVHNSGHITLDSCEHSQFDSHIRGILGMSLEEPRLNKKYFSMVNFLGSAGKTGAMGEPRLTLPADAKFYWYRKTTVAPGRKMGHVNILADSLEELRQKTDQVQKVLGLF